MDKKTTIAFVLIGAILMIWLYMNSPSPVEQKNKQADTTAVNSDTLKNESKVPAQVKHETAAKVKTENTENDSLSFGKYFSVSQEKPQYITVENDLVKLELTSKGGDIEKYFLKKYKNWYSAKADSNSNFYATHVQLINYPEGGGGPDLSFVSSDGKAINTANLSFKANTKKAFFKLTGKDSLVITYTLNVDKNKYIEKKYVFYGDKYSLRYSVKFVGMENIISNNDVDLVWRKGLRFVEENSVDEATFSNASVYYGGDHVQVQASKNNEKVKKDFSGRVDWVAAKDKYFAAIIAPDNPSKIDGAYVEGIKKPTKNNGEMAYYNIRLILPFTNQNIEEKSFTVFIGPVQYNLLKSYGHNFDELVDFGSFFGLKFLIRPISEYVLLPIFTFLHTIIPNYGFVIIVFSLIIKLVLHPLTKSSYESMKKMQLLQPKITEMKEKLKDDPQKMNKEMMKMYSTYGVNPAGGCLPLVLQMPIFIALFEFFKVTIELRQQPFIFWIKDLSRPDIIYNLPFKIPFFGISEISGLALLMGVATFVQQKMSVKDPKQQSLVYIMPVFLTLLFMSFPAGLNLYYLMFNLFSIGQQYYINHKHDGMELQPVKNPKKSKGFFTKMMEAAEQNAKTQQKKKR